MHVPAVLKTFDGDSDDYDYDTDDCNAKDKDKDPKELKDAVPKDSAPADPKELQEPTADQKNQTLCLPK